jgi:hypothetical protein
MRVVLALLRCVASDVRACSGEQAEALDTRESSGALAGASTGLGAAPCGVFPDVPARVPMTYTLAMKACLSTTPADRPSFQQVQTLLRDVQAEVAKGSYVDSDGAPQVRGVPRLLSNARACAVLACARCCTHLS